MAVVSQGKNEFAERIQRIETRGAGVAEVFNAGAPPRARGRARPQMIGTPPPVKRSGGGLMKLPLAIAVGALSYVAAQYATFRIGEIPEELSDPDYILAGQALIALCFVFICRLFLSLTAKTHTVLSILGVVAAMGLMHNLVHLAPDIWAQLFSISWVNELTAQTQYGTFHFREHAIPLSELSQAIQTQAKQLSQLAQG